LKRKLKKKQKISKKVEKARREHAIKRAKQRYGIRLTNTNYQYLCQRIVKEEDNTILINKNDTSSRWLIKYRSVWMFAVFLEEDQIIVTFLSKRRIPKNVIDR